jgi:hypothetical protein
VVNNQAEFGLVRQERVWYGTDFRARRSGARQGKVRSCKGFKLWHGSVRSGAVRLGRARFGFHARAWLGSIGYSGVRFGKGVVARLGAVWRRSCKAWHGYQGEKKCQIY